MSALVITGGRVLSPEGLRPADLAIASGRLVEAPGGGEAGRLVEAPGGGEAGRLVEALGDGEAGRLDARGLLVLPGAIDVHGDAFERQISPRPGVLIDMATALLETDRQLVANGITTAFYGITWSWELGLRGPDTVFVLLDAIERLRPHLAAETLVHLRHETFNLSAEATVLEWIAAGRLGCLAFNDHMSGTFKVRHRPDKMAKLEERSGLSREAFLAHVEAVYAGRDGVKPSIERLAAAAVAAGLPVMSHDDLSPEERIWYRGLGCRIAEFPTTEETASEAARAGEPIVFGAPNVLRGGSHTGCPSAAEMVERKLCTILASDYYYPALLQAPFRLVRDGRTDFASAWGLVSAGPAEALGLGDRGRIAPGLRADLVLIEERPGLPPAVIATLVGGRIVHLVDSARWRA